MLPKTFHRIAEVFALILLCGCGSSEIPDAPPPMDLEAERAHIEENIRKMTEFYEADETLTEEERKEKIEEVRRGYEGYLKEYANSKQARDEQYGTGAE